MTPRLLRPDTRVRLAALLEGADPGRRRPGIEGALDGNRHLLYGAPADFFTGAGEILRRLHGYDLEAAGYQDTEEVCSRGDERTVQAFLAACCHHLHRVEESGEHLAVPTARLEEHINRVMADQQWPDRLRNGGWIPLGESEAEVLRRTLLGNPADVAACQQGDVQVEIVVSTIQQRLEAPNATLVDYGVGLGRVLAGLATAERFRKVTYIGIDDPIPPEVQSLAKKTGAQSKFRTRADYLQKPESADVIMVVN